MKEDNKLVSEWEKMGASTGAMLGRLIGLAAETGLRALDQIVLTPLAKTRDEVNKAAVKSGLRTEHARSGAWSEMGRQYGEKMGNAIGIAMDSAIEATKTNMVRPLEETVNTATQADEQENKK
ncbi:hypothetical protein [Thermincola potens]|uniref:Phasin family protein n=1 Tax=Thermincola potens (strain JR) TaxID=635013 RepID=D5XE38_THEPJ|nr:hypothetical protein [Thermincola potens]ADG81909.1 hypothetical protein TherJR_1044 [Thermincola potens JR]